MKLKWYHWALILILIALVALGIREWLVAPNGHTMVNALDVGQGDGIFVVGPKGEQIIIDGGPDLTELSDIGSHMSFFDNTIDLLVLTHPHADHLFSFPEILKRYKVGAVMITGITYNSALYKKFLDEVRDEKIPVIIADPTHDIDFHDGLKIDVLWPPPIYAGKTGDVNNTSIVLKMTYGKDSMIFTGDMEAKEEKALLASGTNVKSEYLKVGHHGSKTSSSTGFILAVNPKLAVVSVGLHNKYGHPSPSVIERYKHFHIPVETTSMSGTITIDMDGK